MRRVSKKPIKPFAGRGTAQRQGSTFRKALVAPSFVQFLSLLSFWQFSRWDTISCYDCNEICYNFKWIVRPKNTKNTTETETKTKKKPLRHAKGQRVAYFVIVLFLCLVAFNKVFICQEDRHGLKYMYICICCSLYVHARAALVGHIVFLIKLRLCRPAAT